MRMQRYLAFAATTPVLLLSFALTGLMLAWVFPSLPLGGPLLDTLPGYSPSQARELLVQYGVDGRRLYAVASPTLDTLLPICYVTFYAGAVHRCGLPESVGWLAVLCVGWLAVICLGAGSALSGSCGSDLSGSCGSDLSGRWQ